jgi:autotransporter strand-loop-strand O-heptosyltransferase
MYKGLKKNQNIIREVNPTKFICNYNDGAYLEVQSKIDGQFHVEFMGSNGNVEYSTNIGSNMWCKTNKKYAEEYTCTIRDESGNIVFVDKYNPTGKKVYITLESKSLGDTMAWFPYIDEFRKKWNCEVTCSTFHNNLFVDQYPNLEFVSPGTIVHGVYATYRIGLFFDQGNIDYTRHKSDPTKLSLLEMATDILGLEYKEVRPMLRKPNVEKKRRVGIGMHSTAQTKYWNNPNGWQEVTDFLISQGYEVVMMSKEADGYMGNFYPKGVVKLPENNFDDLIDNLNSCEFFIGISSGLSWLAWAVNIPVVLISGFTGEHMEPTDNVVRIIEKSVCNDCWSRHKFDPGDWNWCPDQKGTVRQFECSKAISSDMVIEAIVSNGLVDGEVKKEPIRSVMFYSDKNYEYQAKSLIESILINMEDDVTMFYYTIGFESEIEHSRLVKVPIDVDVNKPTGYRTFEFYKPNIILEHLDRFGGKALFLDTDIVVGKRFDMSYFENGYDYPLLPNGNWSYPFAFEGSIKYDESALMKYFGVSERSMEYVYSNIISFSEKCRDFIMEWKSICDNQYLLSKRKVYFPFPDETAINVVLWKRNSKRNLGRIYLNTLEFEPFEYVEENEGIKGDPTINHGIMGSDLLRCDNSSNIMLYHGIKDEAVLDRVIGYMKEKETYLI